MRRVGPAALMLFAIARAAEAGDIEFATPRSTTIWDPAPSAQALDLVILGDGYTALEQERFNADAAALADHLLAIEPWMSRKNLIRIHRVNVVSRESGTDWPPSNPYLVVDTALDTGY